MQKKLIFLIKLTNFFSNFEFGISTLYLETDGIVVKKEEPNT